MADFKKKSLLDIYFKMTLEEVVEYYQQLRKYELENDSEVKGIQIRKAMYQIVKIILMLDELSKKRRVIIHDDKRNIIHDYLNNEEIERRKKLFRSKIQKDKTRIYSCTHMGRFDIESAIRGVNDSCSFVMADPGVSYQNADGILLRLNGVTWFDLDNRTDRHAANVRQLKVLNNGGNELVFPEAAYNLEPVEIVGKLHPGVVRRAIKTDSYVIPVSIEQYQNLKTKDYILNIGKSVDVHDTQLEESEQIAEYVRQQMIELKKEIWKIYGGEKPTEEEFKNDPLSLEKYKEKIDFIMRDVPSYYTIEQIARDYYQPSELMIDSLKKIKYLR